MADQALEEARSSADEPTRQPAPVMSNTKLKVASGDPYVLLEPVPQQYDSRGVPVAELSQASLRRASKLTPCSSADSFGSVYGIGYLVYFRFLIFMVVLNAIFASIDMITFIPHFAFDGWITEAGNWSNAAGNWSIIDQRSNFYIVTYTTRNRPYYLAGSIISLLCFFATGPVYYAFVTWWVSRNGGEGGAAPKAAVGGGLSVEPDAIPANESFPNSERRWRIFWSGLILTSMALAMFGFNFFLVVLNQNAVASQNDTLATLALAVLGVAISPQGGIEELLLLAAACFLARWCKPKTYSSMRRNQLWMYTIFRYGNVLVLVFSQWIVRQSMACILPAYRPQQAILLQQCPVTFMVDTILVFLLVAIGVMAPINAFLFPVLGRYIWPIMDSWGIPVLKKIFGCSCFNSFFELYQEIRDAELAAQAKHPDDPRRLWPEFVLADEYLDALYRQFLVWLSIPLAPVIGSLLGALACVIDYFLIKLRMVHLHRRPYRIESSMKHHVTAVLTLTALLSLVTFPIGAVTVFTGYDIKGKCPLSLWG